MTIQEALMTLAWGLFGWVIYPLGLLWSLNNLFGMSFEYSFWDWLSAWVFLQVFHNSIPHKK